MAASQQPPDDADWDDEPQRHPAVPDWCPEIEAEFIELPVDEEHDYVLASNLDGQHIYSNAAVDAEAWQ